jgi:DNA protecting protein DprA
MTNAAHAPTCVSAESLSVRSRLLQAQYQSLWIAGDPTTLEPPLVGIIGTREADEFGSSLAREFAATLAKHNVAVLSGGALGIDAAAHGGALDAGGRTAVVLPSGLDHLYPLRHKPMYAQIVAKGGALVSPFPRETPPARWTFPRRNALLAALCDLLVVVQAPAASGSLITAEEARKLGRRILVVPASPDDPRGTGCLRLLRAGAELCATPDDVLTALAHRDGPLLALDSDAPIRDRPRRPPSDGRARSRTPARTHASARTSSPARAKDEPRPDPPSTWTVDEDQRAVYESLAGDARHVDEIAASSKLGAHRVRSALLTLVLLGLAIDRGDGSYRRAV